MISGLVFRRAQADFGRGSRSSRVSRRPGSAPGQGCRSRERERHPRAADAPCACDPGRSLWDAILGEIRGQGQYPGLLFLGDLCRIEGVLLVAVFPGLGQQPEFFVPLGFEGIGHQAVIPDPPARSASARGRPRTGLAGPVAAAGDRPPAIGLGCPYFYAQGHIQRQRR